MTNQTAKEPAETGWQTQLRAGGTAAGTLLATLVVVPNLLAQLGMPFTGAYTACIVTMLLGMLALAWLRIPLLAAPDMALAGWLVYLVGISQGLSWQQLLGIGAFVSVAGAVLFQTAFGRCIPQSLPRIIWQALPVGIGGMLVLMGLTQGHLILPSAYGFAMLGNFQDPLAYFGLLGILITLALLGLQVRGALFYGMLITAVLAFAEGFWVLPAAPFFQPEGLDCTVLQLNPVAVSVPEAVRMLGTGMTMLLTLSVLHWGTLEAFCPGVSERKPQAVSVLFGINLLGSLLGTLPVTIAPASAGGILSGGQGRKFFLTAGLLLLLALFSEPVVAGLADFPVMAIPVLTVSGFLLIRRGIASWGAAAGHIELPEMAAAVSLIVVMPVSGNVTAGLGSALICWCLLTVCSGRWRSIPCGTWLLSLLFLLYFLYGTI